eukprot:5475378-Alexandrium_andersonii.AAC.1
MSDYGGLPCNVLGSDSVRTYGRRPSAYALYGEKEGYGFDECLRAHAVPFHIAWLCSRPCMRVESMCA